MPMVERLTWLVGSVTVPGRRAMMKKRLGGSMTHVPWQHIRAVTYLCVSTVRKYRRTILVPSCVLGGVPPSAWHAPPRLEPPTRPIGTGPQDEGNA